MNLTPSKLVRISIVGMTIALVGVAGRAALAQDDPLNDVVSRKNSVANDLLKFIGLGDKEVLAQAANTFDLDENIIKVLAGMEAAEPFGQVKDALILLRLDEAYSAGRQKEFNAILLDFVKEKAGEWLTGSAYPAAFNRLNIAVKLYKEQLQQLKDDVVIPEYERRMYSRYRQLRNASVSEQNAFDQVTSKFKKDKMSAWEYLFSGGYYLLKPKLYGESENRLKKKKGVKELTKAQKDRLWKSLDQFWISRLELRYQTEKNREQLAKYLLERARDQMRKSLMIKCVDATDDNPIGAFSVKAVMANSKSASARSRGGIAWLRGEYGYRIRPGHWELTINAEGYAPEPIPAEIDHLPRTLSLPDKPEIHTVKLVPAGFIRVSVLDQKTGQSINGAKVVLEMTNEKGKSLTVSKDAKNGVSVFDRLPPGTLTRLTARAKGYRPLSRSGSISIPSKNPSATMRLQPDSGPPEVKWPNPEIFFGRGRSKVPGAGQMWILSTSDPMPLEKRYSSGGPKEFRGKQYWVIHYACAGGGTDAFNTVRVFITPLRNEDADLMEKAQRGKTFYGKNLVYQPLDGDPAILISKVQQDVYKELSTTVYYQNALISGGGYVAFVSMSIPRGLKPKKQFLEALRSRMETAGKGNSK